jgi:hypothetical protein
MMPQRQPMQPRQGLMGRRNMMPQRQPNDDFNLRRMDMLGLDRNRVNEDIYKRRFEDNRNIRKRDVLERRNILDIPEKKERDIKSPVLETDKKSKMDDSINRKNPPSPESESSSNKKDVKSVNKMQLMKYQKHKNNKLANNLMHTLKDVNKDERRMFYNKLHGHYEKNNKAELNNYLAQKDVNTLLGMQNFINKLSQECQPMEKISVIKLLIVKDNKKPKKKKTKKKSKKKKTLKKKRVNNCERFKVKSKCDKFKQS